jgi:hypothetical protein
MNLAYVSPGKFWHVTLLLGDPIKIHQVFYDFTRLIILSRKDEAFIRRKLQSLWLMNFYGMLFIQKSKNCTDFLNIVYYSILKRGCILLSEDDGMFNHLLVPTSIFGTAF